MIKSISYSQDEILNWIQNLHCPKGFDCDVTYSKGAFYKTIEKPRLKFDLDPQYSCVTKACSTNLPLKESSINSLVFDPPFLTYIKPGKSIMGKRFSGYWAYSELENHYRKTIREANRVLKNKGKMIIKCQDIIHNHKIHPTHISVFNWANGFKLKDLFVLLAKHRIPVKGVKKQQHARVFHSYFMVFEKQNSV